MGSKEKAKRGPRASPEQKMAMINFMHANRNFAHGKFEGKLGRRSIDVEWDGLARSLNGMQGCTKSVDQWQRSWADIKKRTRSKHAALKDAKRRTGNSAIKKGMELDEEDEKVVAVMGPVTVHGIPGSRESLPESEEALLQLMNSGAREEKFVVCGASSPVGISSESDGRQVVDTEDEENEDIGEPSTSASGRRSCKIQKRNSGADAMAHRIRYEDRTSHFAEMQEKQIEAISIMAKAQLLQAQNEAKKLELQKDSAEEFRKIGVEFRKMTSYVGKLVDWMTAKREKNE